MGDRAPTEGRGRVVRRRALEAGVWWITLLATYLVLISSATRAEVAAGAVVAAIATAIGVAATAPFRPALPPSSAHWSHVLWLPVDVVRDLGTLVVAAARSLRTRRPAGTMDWVDLEATEREGGEAAGMRAYGVLVLSVSPAGYVVDVDVREGNRDRVLVHRIGPPARSTSAVTR